MAEPGRSAESRRAQVAVGSGTASRSRCSKRGPGPERLPEMFEPDVVIRVVDCAESHVVGQRDGRIMIIAPHDVVDRVDDIVIVVVAG